MIKFCIASHVAARDLATIRALNDTHSRAAPLAPDIINTALLMALERKGEWPALSLRKGQGQVGHADFITLWSHAFTVGRVKSNGTPARFIPGPVQSAYLAMGSPTRPPRVMGDWAPLNFDAVHFLAMWKLLTGSNAVHGLPPATARNVRADLLRRASAFIQDPSTSLAEAAFWRTMLPGKASSQLANAIRLAIMRVDTFTSKDGEQRPVVHSRAVQNALASPLVGAIIDSHTTILYQGLRPDGTSVDSDPGYVVPAAILVAARAKFNSTDPGTWSRFQAHLELHPRRAVLYRHFLGAQRRGWVQELLAEETAWGGRLGDASGLGSPADFLDEVSGSNPSSAMETEEDLSLEEAAVDAALDGDDEDDHWASSDVWGDSDDEGDDEGDCDDAPHVHAHGPPSRASSFLAPSAARPSSGARPRFRGKAWYPPLLPLVEAARPLRRCMRLDDAFSNLVFRRPLSQVLHSMPLLPPGATPGSSIVTNGFAVSVPFKKARTPAQLAKEAAENPVPVLGHKRARSSRRPVPAPSTSSPPSSAPCPATTALARALRPLAQQERIISVDAGATHLVMTYELVHDITTGLPRERIVGLSRLKWRALRKDEERLTLTRSWCAALAAPGGAFERLSAVTRRCSTLADFLLYSNVAHGTTATGVHSAYADVLDERLRPRWAQAAFRTWTAGQRILDSFWASLRAGNVSDGTYGVRPVILYGCASFSATGRGRHSSPTTSMRASCIKTCGAAWVRDVSEHRSTKVCSHCHRVLDKVEVVTPERIYAAARAKGERALPLGWSRPPARTPRKTCLARGLQRCRYDECRAVSFRHRDIDPCRLILTNALSVDAGHGTLPCMRTGHHPEDVINRPFGLWA